MRFGNFFGNAQAPVISFEVFPPKTEKGMRQLEKVLPELANLHPRYMTVTFGAMGSTQSRTLEIASKIKNEYRIETACHLTCVGSTRADIDRILDEIASANIENIVALRGDPPQGETEFTPPDDGYAHANELVEHIKHFEAQQFGIAVAGYPEKHLEATDLATDLRNLRTKVNAGADAIITQLFYDNSDFFRFVYAARALGIEIPIVPGLLPILSSRQIRRIASLCGAKIPATLQAELEAASENDRRAVEVGVRQCVAQATELLWRGVPGIHFYVLNKANHMVQIMEQIGPVLEQTTRLYGTP